MRPTAGLKYAQICKAATDDCRKLLAEEQQHGCKTNKMSHIKRLNISQMSRIRHVGRSADEAAAIN